MYFCVGTNKVCCLIKCGFGQSVLLRSSYNQKVRYSVRVRQEMMNTHSFSAFEWYIRHLRSRHPVQVLVVLYALQSSQKSVLLSKEPPCTRLWPALAAVVWKEVTFISQNNVFGLQHRTLQKSYSSSNGCCFCASERAVFDLNTSRHVGLYW